MTRHLLLFAILSFATPILLLQARQQSQTTQGPPGTLRGIVIREGTTDPIPEVQIAVGRGAINAALNAQSIQTAIGALGAQGIDPSVIQSVLNSAAPNAAVAVANSGPNYTAVTDSGGRFVIEGLPPGQYPITARRDGYFGPSVNGNSPQVGRGSATVVSQQTADVQLSLVPGSVVSGRIPQGISVVVHEGVEITGQLIVDGQRIAAPVRIALQPADSSTNIPVYNQVGRFQPAIAADGTFSIPSVPEATYRVQATIQSLAVLNAQANQVARGRGAQAPASAPPALPETAYVADVRQGGTSVYDKGIEVATARVNPIEVIVNTNGGTIEGSLTRNGQPAGSAITVVLVPAESRRKNPDLYKSTGSTARGTFQFNAVPPGQYKLFAFESVPSTAYQNAEFMKAFEDRGVTVSVAAGARLSQTVPVIPAQPSR